MLAPCFAAANAAGMVSVALTGTVGAAELTDANLVIDSLRELSPARIEKLLQGD